ncbi:unnamed protein product [Blepharisma stoltei]|uniref:Uncharacterized protein n=1 Tax=Blepharisma stoltei TaxID=1481888 RepID=A0AAU9JL28_9CILI|nr:unnamed protein product [Blepharisma stoltei]
MDSLLKSKSKDDILTESKSPLLKNPGATIRDQILRFQNQISDLQKENDALKRENLKLSTHLEFLQKKDSQAMKAEISFKNLIRGYQDELSGRKSIFKLSKDDVKSVSGSYENLFDSIELMKDKVQEMLSQKEEALGAIFNTKLKEISKQLEKEKKEKFEFIDSLAEKEIKLTEELELLKASVFMIESKNNSLERENKKLAINLKERDIEIKGLQDKLFKLKKKKMKLPPIEMPRSLSTIPPDCISDKRVSPAMVNNPINTEREEISSLNTQNYVYKLQRQLKVEKNNARAAREAYRREVENKGELFKLIQECYEDTKEHVQQVKMSSIKKLNDYLKQKFMDELTKREKILELITEKLYQG